MFLDVDFKISRDRIDHVIDGLLVKWHVRMGPSHEGDIGFEIWYQIASDGFLGFCPGVPIVTLIQEIQASFDNLLRYHRKRKSMTKNVVFQGMSSMARKTMTRCSNVLQTIKMWSVKKCFFKRNFVTTIKPRWSRGWI